MDMHIFKDFSIVKSKMSVITSEVQLQATCCYDTAHYKRTALEILKASYQDFSFQHS